MFGLFKSKKAKVMRDGATAEADPKQTSAIGVGTVPLV